MTSQIFAHIAKTDFCSPVGLDDIRHDFYFSFMKKNYSIYSIFWHHGNLEVTLDRVLDSNELTIKMIYKYHY